MAHITDPPAEGYIREAKFRGQIRHSGEKDKGTHGEGWHRARGHLVVLPSGGILTFAFPASLPLIFGKKNCQRREDKKSLLLLA